MLTDKMVQALLTLSDKDRREAMRLLCPPDDSPCVSRQCKYLLSVIGNIMGVDPMLKTKRPKWVWARALVMYKVRQAGATFDQIATYFHCHRVNVRHHVLNVANMIKYPHQYRDVYPYWEAFNNITK